MLTPKAVKQIREELNALLAEYAKQDPGLESVQVGSAQYDKGNGNITFKLAVVVEGGRNEEAVRYKREAPALGLPPLGTKYENSIGATYQVAGLRSGRAKKRVLVEDELGTRYITTVEAVRAMSKNLVRTS